MYAGQAAGDGDLDEFSNAAREGRAAARSRRLALSQGKEALNGAGAPPAAENLDVNRAGAPPAASNGQGAPSGAQGAPEGTAAATNGRAVSVQRRRQLSQGKEALNGAGAPPAAVQPALLHGRAAELQAENLDVNGAGAPPAASNGQGAPSGAQVPPGGTAVATDGAGAANLGRAVSVQRRRQLSQGKQALNGDGNGTAAAAGAGAPPAAEDQHVDGTGSGREQARARRAEASRFGSAGISRPQREGRVTHPPKVVVSPTHGGQRVTGLRIGPGVRVTGDEAGAALPVSGPQYVAADGPAPALGAGPQVGLVRTPQGLVVSGTTVRSKVPITGDEAGEHLPITGEADQKFDDDLTPRSDGTYRPAQFPRRADPHGASAVGTRLGVPSRMTAFSGDGPWLPLETTDGGLAVTGTAAGRSERVTGNEAGACRPITGDQYQDLSSYSSECGGIGGGTAPAAHLNRARLDPVTAGKVTVAQTWGGQRVTGPNVEHRPNVTGDEPGACRP
ncbi:MAG TPA: CsoS2 family carboxysome shell protein, partial [Egibacteraceae bacterium]|nr:CsoS2 family carboxysome shell protein [Egibacteraceae bacterium]